MNDTPLLSLLNLTKQFRVGKRVITAVQDISFDVNEGECIGIVGESGSGKTTVANLILGLHAPTSGEIHFRGEVLPSRRELRHRRMIQLVQQNPYSALNPRRTVGASLKLVLDVHGHCSPSDRADYVHQLLEEVGLDRSLGRRSPVALSGGQRQRVAIARAIACQSELIVLDEPTSALDVLVQARVLKLLSTLRKNRTLTYLFISHDISVVRNIADRVAVFDAGKLIEFSEVGMIFTAPKQDYTRSLLGSVPVIDEDEVRLRDRLALKNA